ncbi:MAG TPA: signal peptidase I [bacterium]|nr:signal peptidase I [Patescibacteria group bacterium]HOC96488.1 signal peptidase I [bacterium]HPO11320.1 signal peptidase I [bacterium]
MENSQKKDDFKDFLKTTITALVIVFLVRHFLIQPFYVRGSSMEPNFYEKDYLIIDEISYRFEQPKRGDIIVFKLKTQGYNEYLIKRIIGLPGETVIVKDGKVTIKNQDHPDGFILDESYLPTGLETLGDVTEVVPDDSYFIMGDNRAVSFDSRYFGSIKRESIVGKVLLRGFPFSKFGIIKNITNNQ